MAASDRLVVGRIGRPHGVRGEVTVLPDTDDPDRFAPGAALTTEDGRSLVVATAQRYRDRGLRVRFEGIASRSDAESLRGTSLTVASSQRRPLDSGEYWPDDLVGLRAVSPDGSPLGVVAGVEFGVGQDRLVITTATGDVLVPFVDDLVGDPDGGQIVIRDPGGLFPG